MSLSDREKNCLYEVCCEPEPAASVASPAARASLAAALMTDGVCSDRGEADAVAAWVYKHFDLAPRGSLRAFKAEIARVARA